MTNQPSTLEQTPKRTKCEIYSRVVGYIRSVANFNKAKQQEFKDRKTFKI